MKRRLGKKFLKSEKRIISGIKKLDTMRFIVGRFTSFSPEIEFLPSFVFFVHKTSCPIKVIYNRLNITVHYDC